MTTTAPSRQPQEARRTLAHPPSSLPRPIWWSGSRPLTPRKRPAPPRTLPSNEHSLAAYSASNAIADGVCRHQRRERQTRRRPQATVPRRAPQHLVRTSVPGPCTHPTAHCQRPQPALTRSAPLQLWPRPQSSSCVNVNMFALSELTLWGYSYDLCVPSPLRPSSRHTPCGCCHSCLASACLRE